MEEAWQLLEERTLRLVSSEEDSIDAEFTLEERDDDCRITCSFKGDTLSSCSDDFFEALCELRGQLEESNLRPCCYGSVLNAFPSGMARSMGQGLKVYLLKKGSPGGELVETFEECSVESLSTVSEQRQFYEDWLNSLG